MGWQARQFARFKTALPIELRPKGLATPLRGQTADIGLGGCYVEMTFTQELSTLVDIVLWVAGTKIVATGEVVSKHPAFGNGFKFIQLTKQAQAELNHYLESLQPTERMPDESPFAGSPALPGAK